MTPCEIVIWKYYLVTDMEILFSDEKTSDRQLSSSIRSDEIKSDLTTQFNCNEENITVITFGKDQVCMVTGKISL